MRDKPHTLSEREEEILAATSELSTIPENVYDMLAYADMEFPEIEDEEGNKVKLSHSNYSLFIKVRIVELEKTLLKVNFQHMRNIKIHLPQRFMVE